MPLKKNLDRQYNFKKSLGQNILRDLNVIKKIVANLNLKSEDVVLEIGPGLGALTDELTGYHVNTIAIEKDTRFFEQLTEKYRDKNVRVINADALKFDYSELKQYNRKIKIVANLPYNVSTQILFRVIEHKQLFASFLFMFQKEVADRITAQPSTKDYGILSVISQYHTRPTALLKVPGKCFVPVPKVDSTVVHFDIYDTPPHKVKDEDLLKSIVKAAFMHRRKTLANCFKSFKYKKSGELDIVKIFDDAGIDLKRRGETLSVEEFTRLTDTFSDNIDQ